MQPTAETIQTTINQKVDVVAKDAAYWKVKFEELQELKVVGANESYKALKEQTKDQIKVRTSREIVLPWYLINHTLHPIHPTPTPLPIPTDLQGHNQLPRVQARPQGFRNSLNRRPLNGRAQGSEAGTHLGVLRKAHQHHNPVQQGEEGLSGETARLARCPPRCTVCSQPINQPPSVLAPPTPDPRAWP